MREKRKETKHISLTVRKDLGDWLAIHAIRQNTTQTKIIEDFLQKAKIEDEHG